MRSPQPVIVDSPSPLKPVGSMDSIFVIHLCDSDRCEYLNRDMSFNNMVQLDSILAVNGGKKLEGHLALQVEANEEDRIDSVIEILKHHDIIRFNLVTDLDSELPTK